MRARVACLIGILFSFAIARADNGISPDKILIGQVSTLSGTSSSRPIEKKIGSDVFFAKVNGAGGVNGRKIELKVYDDKYNSELTASFGQKLIEEDKVFCLFQSYGTMTSQALVPLVTKAGVPLLFPSTGAENFRNPVIRMVYNVRLSSFMEAEALVDFSFDELQIKDIGLFYQDDFYGVAMKSAAHRAASRRHATIEVEASHKRDSVDVADAVAKMKRKNPRAVLLLTLNRQAARFIAVAKESGYSPVYLAPQSVLTEDFLAETKKSGARVFVSQGLPSLEQISTPLIKQFRDDMAASGQKTPSMTMFEGYFEAALLVEGIKRAGSEPSRKSFIAALDGMSNLDLGGIPVHFSDTNHQGISKAYVSELKANGKIVPLK